jgi:hypothetical protein
MSTLSKIHKSKAGRPKSLQDGDTVTILLEKEMAAWGKARPEGLSALIRRLLREYRDSLQ